jgi:hypothetical protein
MDQTDEVTKSDRAEAGYDPHKQGQSGEQDQPDAPARGRFYKGGA